MFVLASEERRMRMTSREKSAGAALAARRSGQARHGGQVRKMHNTRMLP